MHTANLQINSMPQLPTLPNPPTNPIPRLKNRDLNATLQQNIRTSQPSESSAHDAHTDRLLRCRHGALQHVLRVHVLIRVILARVQVLEDARHAGGGGVGVVLASLHGSKTGSGSGSPRYCVRGSDNDGSSILLICMYSKHCEFQPVIQCYTWANHRDVCRSRRLKGGDSFTRTGGSNLECKASWQEAARAFHIIDITNFAVGTGSRRSAYYIHHNKNNAIFIQRKSSSRYRFKTLGRQRAPRSPDVARLGNREIEPIMLLAEV